MASKKKIGKAIAAGLVTFGKLDAEEKIRNQELERQKKIDEREARRLELQEQESKLRQENMKRDNMMKDVAWKNQQLVQAMVKGNMSPQAVGNAITEFGSAGEVYDYNPERSREIGEGAVVYNVSKYEKDPVSGKRRTDPTTGEFVKTPFPGQSNEVILKDTTEFQRFAAQHGNPEHMFGMMLSEITDEDLFQSALERDKIKAEAQAQTPQGKAALGLKGAQTEKIKKETEMLGQPKPGKEKTEIQLLGGGKKKLSHVEAQNLGKAFEKMNKNIPSVTSLEEAARVNETKDNPEIREMFANDISLVVSDPAQLKRVKDEWIAQGLNAEYFDLVLEEAQLNAEEWQAAEDDRTPNLVQKTINKILGTGFGTGK